MLSTFASREGILTQSYSISWFQRRERTPVKKSQACFLQNKYRPLNSLYKLKQIYWSKGLHNRSSINLPIVAIMKSLWLFHLCRTFASPLGLDGTTCLTRFWLLFPLQCSSELLNLSYMYCPCHEIKSVQSRVRIYGNTMQVYTCLTLDSSASTMSIPTKASKLDSTTFKGAQAIASSTAPSTTQQCGMAIHTTPLVFRVSLNRYRVHCAVLFRITHFLIICTNPRRGFAE